MADHDTLKTGIAAVADGDYECFDIESNTITATSQITTNSGASVKTKSSTGDGIISGNNAYQIFRVVSGSTLDLEGLTLSDGYVDGGGVSISPLALPHSSANTTPHSTAVLCTTTATSSPIMCSS